VLVLRRRRRPAGPVDHRPLVDPGGDEDGRDADAEAVEGSITLAPMDPCADLGPLIRCFMGSSSVRRPDIHYYIPQGAEVEARRGEAATASAVGGVTSRSPRSTWAAASRTRGRGRRGLGGLFLDQGDGSRPHGWLAVE
jgi:hypothetical protein